MKNINYVIPIIMLLFLSSCGIYQNNITNVPLFKEKGEFVGGASVYLSNNLERGGINVQGAYAVSDKVGLMMNYIAYNHKRKRYDNDDNPSNDNDGFSGFMIEPGAGYYRAIGKRNRGALGIYGLLGLQNMEHRRNEKSFDYNIIKPSFLFNIGYTDDFFDIAFSTKLSMVHFYNFDKGLAAPDSGDFDRDYGVKVLHNQQSFMLAEPALTIRMGYKYGKIQFQLGVPMGNIDLIYGFNINWGLTFHIPSKRKRKSKEEVLEDRH